MPSCRVTQQAKPPGNVGFRMTQPNLRDTGNDPIESLLFPELQLTFNQVMAAR
ncbi:MAG: hypothetical protein F6K19_50535 [Cyanothece sp. SIO1E1]|nr:hypothetical protein [Cyanothece sp. SIO1E1]